VPWPLQAEKLIDDSIPHFSTLLHLMLKNTLIIVLSTISLENGYLQDTQSFSIIFF